MLACHACLRRCLRALLSTTPHGNAPRLAPAVTGAPLLVRALQTNAAPSASRITRSSSSSWGLRKRENIPHRPTATTPPDDGASRPKSWQEAVGQPLKKSFKRVSPQQNGTNDQQAIKESHLRTELKYLKDPVKLADHVRYVLRSNNDEKALALCRMSSRAMANTVSWNYLIDWQMQNGRTNAALSTYNEMKKRAQKPDSHTYVLLLRGLANYAHHPNSLAKALSIYHSLKGPDSQFQPNIIHVNAVLKVCARANDMDSLWDIASRLPEKGPHAANSWTFTTILNYMRMNLLSEIQDEPGSENSLRRMEEVIVKGKQLWSVILARWREGELMIDEALVCSMGRLLLAGSRPRDWDNVFSLVQQTMNITRLEPRLGTVARDMSGAPKIRAPSTPEDLKDNPSEMTLNIGEEAADSIFDPLTVKPASHHQNTRVPSKTGRGRGLFFFVQPGNNTLSLVLESCQKTILKHAAKGYWELFTDPEGHGIKPDLDNVHMMLRNLRRAGASTDATQLVEDLPRLNLLPDGRTFWLAMTACKKDTGNPNAIENARRLLDYMQRTLSVPNIKTISIYLEFARQSQKLTNITSALQRIWPSVMNLKSILNYGDYGEEYTKLSPAEKQTYLEEALRLFKSVINCYAYLLDPARKFELGSLRHTYEERSRTLDAFTRRNNKFLGSENVVLQPAASRPARALPQRNEQSSEAEP